MQMRQHVFTWLPPSEGSPCSASPSAPCPEDCCGGGLPVFSGLGGFCISCASASASKSCSVCNEHLGQLLCKLQDSCVALDRLAATTKQSRLSHIREKD